MMISKRFTASGFAWILDNNNDSINKLLFVQQNSFGHKRDFPQLDKMQGVIINIRASTTAKESRHRLISMLEDLLSDIEPEKKKELLTKKHDMKMTISLEGRISNMCNLSDVFEERAEKRGLEKGMKKGIEQGMTLGINILVDTLKELQKSNDYIVQKLTEKFSISEKEAIKYL